MPWYRNVPISLFLPLPLFNESKKEWQLVNMTISAELLFCCEHPRLSVHVIHVENETQGNTHKKANLKRQLAEWVLTSKHTLALKGLYFC